MLGGINPKQMQGMMRKMGISQEDVSAERVTIEMADGSLIKIENPVVAKIKMQGQISFQITGEVSEESEKVEDSSADVKTIQEKTGCSEEMARETLEKTGDLAQAILELSN